MTAEFDILHHQLPAGEWQGLKELPKGSVPGAMAEKGVIFIEGHHILTDKTAFMKVYPVNDELRPSELSERHDRWLSVDADPTIPSCPILASYDWTSKGQGAGLVVCLLKCDSLQSLMKLGPSPELSLQVLRELDLPVGDWVHVDVCADNTARTPEGQLVFLDADSWYPNKQDVVHMTKFGGMKSHRVPKIIQVQMINTRPTSGGVRSDVAHAKFSVELAVLAAEAWFGGHGGSAGTSYTLDTWLIPWLEAEGLAVGSEQSAAAASAIFTKAFRPALEYGEPIDLEALASELELALLNPSASRSRNIASVAPEAPLIDQAVHRVDAGSSSHSDPPGGLDAELGAPSSAPPPNASPNPGTTPEQITPLPEPGRLPTMMQVEGGKLRAGHFTDDEILTYYLSLRDSSGASERSVDVWRELIFVAQCYVRDEKEWSSLAAHAFKYFPDDDDVKRMYALAPRSLR